MWTAKVPLVRFGRRRYSAFPRKLQRCAACAAIASTPRIANRCIDEEIMRLTPCSRSAAALLLSLALVVPSLAGAATDEELARNARLLASARNDDAAGVTRALKEGAAVDSRNRLGETGLLIALKKNRADMAQAFLDADANVNVAAINGVTPLMAAAYAGDAAMARALIDRGANVAAVDELGKNAITYAAGEGRTDVVRLLLAHGVDPNAIYRNDLTALMWAAGYGQTETARALIDAGARVDLVDNRGKSAIDMARDFKHVDTVQVLEQALRSPRH